MFVIIVYRGVDVVQCFDVDADTINDCVLAWDLARSLYPERDGYRFELVEVFIDGSRVNITGEIQALRSEQ